MVNSVPGSDYVHAIKAEARKINSGSRKVMAVLAYGK
jgi:hypothetical protein